MSGGDILDCNCGLLRRAARRASRFYDAHLAPSGLRTTQFSILALIDKMTELSVKELAVRLELDRTTMGQNLKPLERDGLLVTSRSMSDGRVHTISLTAVGSAALARAAPLWKEAQAAFERLNGAEATRALQEFLGGLRFEE